MYFVWKSKCVNEWKKKYRLLFFLYISRSFFASRTCSYIFRILSSKSEVFHTRRLDGLEKRVDSFFLFFTSEHSTLSELAIVSGFDVSSVLLALTSEKILLRSFSLSVFGVAVNPPLTLFSFSAETSNELFR